MIDLHRLNENSIVLHGYPRKRFECSCFPPLTLLLEFRSSDGILYFNFFTITAWKSLRMYSRSIQYITILGCFMYVFNVAGQDSQTALQWLSRVDSELNHHVVMANKAEWDFETNVTWTSQHSKKLFHFFSETFSERFENYMRKSNIFHNSSVNCS